MRERREVAAGADRAFLWNNRMHAPVQHLAKQLDDLVTDSAETERQDVRTQQHHRPHLLSGKRISNSACVAAYKVQLKLAQFAMRNPGIGELAKSGVDSVNHLIAPNDLFDQFARRQNPRTRQRRNVNGLASQSDRCELNKRNLLPLQLHLGSLVRIVEALKRGSV